MGWGLEAERLLPRTLLALAALALAVALLALWSGLADAATTLTVNETSDAKDRKISGARAEPSTHNVRGRPERASRSALL